MFVYSLVSAESLILSLKFQGRNNTLRRRTRPMINMSRSISCYRPFMSLYNSLEDQINEKTFMIKITSEHQSMCI